MRRRKKQKKEKVINTKYVRRYSRGYSPVGEHIDIKDLPPSAFFNPRPTTDTSSTGTDSNTNNE